MIKDLRIDRAIVVFVVAIGLGRLAGLVRELIIGYLYGSTRDADLIVTLLSIPDTAINFLMVSGFNAVLVPFLIALNEEQKIEIFSGLFSFWAILSASLAITFGIFSTPIVGLLASGVLPLDANEEHAFSWVFGGMFLACLSGLLVSWLAHKQSFFFGAIGTLLINILVIVGLFIGQYAESPIVCMAVALLIGGFLRLVIQWLAAFNTGMRIQFRRPRLDISLCRSIFISAVAMTSLTLAPLAFRSIASSEFEGAMVQFALATKILEAPLVIVFWSLGLISLPALSNLYRIDERAGSQMARKMLVRGLILSLGCYLAVAGGAPGFIRFLFHEGKFSPAELENIIDLIRVGAIGLPAMATTTILLNDSFARYQYLRSLIITFCVFTLCTLGAYLVKFEFGLMGIMFFWPTLYLGVSLGLLLAERKNSLRPNLSGWFVRRFLLVFTLIVVTLESRVLQLLLPESELLVISVGSLLFGVCGIRKSFVEKILSLDAIQNK